MEMHFKLLDAHTTLSTLYAFLDHGLGTDTETISTGPSHSLLLSTIFLPNK